MVRIGLLALLMALLVAACGGGDDAAPAQSQPSGAVHTETVHWSPFDDDGKLSSELGVQELGKGECLGRSITIGGRGYRCKAGRWVLDPCWRSGDGVACVGYPWDDRVSTIRVSSSWFDAHPTDGGSRARPWAIELADGHRCRVLQSSHSTVELRGRPLHVDYDCDGGLVLLRNLSRGDVWTVATARWNHGRYAVEPAAKVRRAYFG